jgi:hypothetical protein
MLQIERYYEDNILGLYDLLVSSENKNKLINNKLNELNSNELIIYYNKKVMQMKEYKHDNCIHCYPQMSSL